MTDEDLASKLAQLQERAEEVNAANACPHVVLGTFMAVDAEGGKPFKHRIAFRCIKQAGHEPLCGDGTGLEWDSTGRLVRPAEERQPPGRDTLGWQVAPLGTARPSSFNELMSEATDAAQLRNPEADR